MGKLLFVLALLAFGIFWTYRVGRRREEERARFALSLSAGFEAAPAASAWADFQGLPLFGRGRGGVARNRVYADIDGVSVELFDYYYWSRQGRSTQVQQTIVGVKGTLGLADLTLSPEGLGDKLAGAFGKEDIDFPDSPEFSRLYSLRGQPEYEVRRCLGRAARDWLERHPGLTVEANAGTLVVYRPGRVAAEAELGPAWSQALELTRLLAPEAVRARGLS
jgi:hypothetical protein